jgi:hypothetical protein
VKIVMAKFLGAKGGKTSDAIKAFDYLVDLKKKSGIKLVGERGSPVGGPAGGPLGGHSGGPARAAAVAWHSRRGCEAVGASRAAWDGMGPTLAAGTRRAPPAPPQHRGAQANPPARCAAPRPPPRSHQQQLGRRRLLGGAV